MSTELPFELDALEHWLREQDLHAGPVRLRRIGDGHSNLTYAVDSGPRRFVLRRPPPPPLPRGAHDMRREARILAALAGTAVPVPRLLAVAEQGDVMDVPCYAMEHLDGLIATDELPDPLNTAEAREEIAGAFIDALAALHTVDWQRLGLTDMGRPDGYLIRQLDRLPNLIASGDKILPAPIDEIRERLRSDVPISGEPALLHGDFRFGNVMLSPVRPGRLLGVLDWELAGIGDPLADLGYTLATYAVPDEPAHALTAMSGLTTGAGFPTRSALAERYAAATGRQVVRLPWYQAFALFKLAVLFEYNRRKTSLGGGDSYYANPALVDGLLEACFRNLSADSDAMKSSSRELDHHAAMRQREEVR